MVHTTVLPKESIEGLALKAGDVFLDGTLGNGGHSKLVCETFEKKVRIIGLDADSGAIERSKVRLAGSPCDITFVQGNFRNIDQVVENLGLTNVSKILLDLGLSSNQLEESKRGFTFQKDEPLLMTFRDTPTEDDLTAYEIVNGWDEENLETILKSYGEERFAKRIAKAIVLARNNGPIKTTHELVEIVKKATPFFYHRLKIHPATKTFQALRITANDEVRALKDGLERGFKTLVPGGRMAVISFHSIEDRIVKTFFKQLTLKGEGTLITKKPITPSEEELRQNPRSRSAKLRIIEKN